MFGNKRIRAVPDGAEISGVTEKVMVVCGGKSNNVTIGTQSGSNHIRLRAILGIKGFIFKNNFTNKKANVRNTVEYKK